MRIFLWKIIFGQTLSLSFCFMVSKPPWLIPAHQTQIQQSLIKIKPHKLHLHSPLLLNLIDLTTHFCEQVLTSVRGNRLESFFLGTQVVLDQYLSNSSTGSGDSRASNVEQRAKNPAISTSELKTKISWLATFYYQWRYFEFCSWLWYFTWYLEIYWKIIWSPI